MAKAMVEATTAPLPTYSPLPTYTPAPASAVEVVVKEVRVPGETVVVEKIVEVVVEATAQAATPVPPSPTPNE